MKKGILVFAVALLFVALVPRPVAAALNIDWGIKGGFSLAREKWSDETTASDNLTKPVFGAFLAFNLNKSFAIQPEVYYLTQGGIWQSESDLVTTKWVGTYNYLHIPVLAKVRFMTDKKLSPIIFAGPALGFLLSAHEKYYVDGALNYSKSIKTWFKKTNFSVVFGGGVEYKLDKLLLVLDIRYDLGLANIDLSDIPTDTLKTRSLMFMVGVGF
jgi:hypothetical protein